MSEVLRCAVIGEEPLLVECARVLRERGHKISAFVSPAEDLLAWAEQEGLPTVRSGDDLAVRLAEDRPDYLFSIANLRMLSADVLAVPLRRAINFHDGPLPRHAGRFATSWAILDGDTTHGVTWHVMTAEADAGDLLVQRMFPVDPVTTVHDLDIACFEAGVDSFGELVDRLASGRAVGTPQDLSRRTYHGRWDGPPRGGLVDWTRPAAALDALVRATAFGNRTNGFGVALVPAGDRLLVARAVNVTGVPSHEPPGTVLGAEATGVRVATADLDVVLTGLVELSGTPVDPVGLVAELTTRGEGRFGDLDAATADGLARAGRAAMRVERDALRVLGELEPVFPPQLGEVPATAGRDEPVPVPPGLLPDASRPVLAVTIVLALLQRLGRTSERDVALAVEAGSALVVDEVPLRIPDGLMSCPVGDAVRRVAEEIDAVRARSPHRRDLGLRHPGASAAVGRRLPVLIAVGDPAAAPDADRALVVRVTPDGVVTFHDGRTMDPAHVGWLHDRLALLAAAAGAEAGRPLGELLLLHDEELALVGSAADNPQDYPREATVSQLVRDLACAVPDRVAVRSGPRELTYGEVDDGADRVAARLAQRGAGPGEVVGIYLRRDVELVIALLGVMRTGAAYVPIDPIYPPARIRHMVADSGMRLVLTDDTLAASVAQFTAPDATSSVTPVDVAAAVADATVPFGPDRSAPGGTAYVIYTSGSTGLPKGVQVGHRALVNFLWTMARTPGFGSADSLAALTTICFDIAGLELFLPLVFGGSVEVLTQDVTADGVALRERIESRPPTVLQATPTTWQMLLAAGWPGAPGMRALCGGEQLPPALAEQLVGKVGELYNMYGPTETTIWSTVDRVLSCGRITIGRPIGNTGAHVLDERGEPIPPGVPGELYLSGDGVADGYLNRPALTAERFVGSPTGHGRAYRTGDLVRWLNDGRLEYLGRIDGQIKLDGYRIELGEVESALRRQRGVTGAVVVIREDHPGERRLVGYVTGDGEIPGQDELRHALRATLPAYMVPSALVPVPSLPRTPNGKIDRAALPAPGRPRVAGSSAAVRSDLERRIARIWAQVLGVEEVGAEANFFDLGGTSLKLTSVVVMLREHLECPVTRLDMFRHPTVRAMAAHLSGANGAHRQDPGGPTSTESGPTSTEAGADTGETTVASSPAVGGGPRGGRNTAALARRRRQRRRGG